MSIAAIALLAALSATPQENEDRRVETRSEIRIVTADGEGPGRMDADGDGVVTREEFTAPMGRAFDRLDADRDGRLSTEELEAGHGEGGPEGMPRVMMFRGGPGGPGGPGEHSRVIINGRPLEGHGMPHVMMLDGEHGPGDRNVFIMRGPGGPEGGPDGRRIEFRSFGGPGGHGDMDADNDGRVTEEEFLAPMREAFRSMDDDSDGALAEGERPGPRRSED